MQQYKCLRNSTVNMAGHMAGWMLYQKKDDCTMPTLAESQPNCSAMGIMAMLMLTLSMLQSMNATKQSPMIVHLRFQPLVFVAACCDNNEMSQTPNS